MLLYLFLLLCTTTSNGISDTSRSLLSSRRKLVDNINTDGTVYSKGDYRFQYSSGSCNLGTPIGRQVVIDVTSCTNCVLYLSSQYQTPQRKKYRWSIKKIGTYQFVVKGNRETAADCFTFANSNEVSNYREYGECNPTYGGSGSCLTTESEASFSGCTDGTRYWSSDETQRHCIWRYCENYAGYIVPMADSSCSCFPGIDQNNEISIYSKFSSTSSSSSNAQMTWNFKCIYSDCTEGYELKGNQCDEISLCNAGTYISNSNCVPCAEGKYMNENGHASNDCKECPTGYQQDNVNQIECKECLAGLQQDETGQIQCKECLVGRYSNIVQSFSCLNCTNGKYQSEKSQITCDDCPEGYSRNTVGKSSCEQCAVGQYGDQKHLSNCINCQEGQYSNVVQSSSCLECDIGTSQKIEGEIRCDDCALGRYQNLPGQQTCKKCKAGLYANETKMPTCHQCLHNTFSTEIGSTDNTGCKDCPHGWSSSGVIRFECFQCGLDCGCDVGTFEDLNNNHACTDCPAGYYTDRPGLKTCSNCALGKYVAIEKSIVCQGCPTGYYAEVVASEDCTACVAGKFNINSESDSESECTPCERGKYSDQAGRNTIYFCQDCVAGTFNPGSGSALKDACIDCIVGYYSNEVGGFDSDVCRECPMGFHGEINETTLCFQCASGQYNLQLHATSCNECQNGKYSEEMASQKECTQCPRGYFQPETSQSDCLDCNAGEYQPNNGMTACLKCTVGLYSNVTGPHSVCDICPIGYNTLNGEGLAECFICRSGLYGIMQENIPICIDCTTGQYRGENDLMNSLTQCLDCNPGYYQNRNGSVNCLICEGGYFSINSGNSKCMFCPKGYYRKEDGGLFDCSLCQSGQTSSTGQSSCLECSKGKYSSLSDLTCKKCKRGRYNDKKGEKSCRTCPGGWAQNKTEATSCSQCSAGLYNETGNKFCISCPAGWQSSISAMQCSFCSSGKYSPARSSQCTSCTRGQFSINTKSETCKICSEMEMELNGNTGEKYSMWYQNEIGSTSCKTCETGQTSLGYICATTDNSIAAAQAPIKLSNLVSKKDPSGKTIQFLFSWDKETMNRPTRFVLEYSYNVRGCVVSNDNDDDDDNDNEDDIRNQKKSIRTNIIDWNSLKDKEDHTFIIETILPVPAWCGLHFSKENNAQVFAEYGNYLTPFVRSGPHVSFPTFASAYQCDILSFFNTHQSNPELWECLKCPEGTYCDGPIVFQKVRARFGWYRYIHEKAPLVLIDFTNISFVKCKNPGACLGAPNPKYNGDFTKEYQILNKMNNNTESIFDDPSDQINAIEECNWDDGYQRYCDNSNLPNNITMVSRSSRSQTNDNTLQINVNNETQEEIMIQRRTCRFCATCKVGYRRGTGYECLKCPPESSGLTIFLLVLGSVGLLVAIVALILNTMSDAGNDLASDALQKIFVNYLQAAALALAFPLKWPKAINDLLIIQGAISTVGEFFVNPDCQLRLFSAAELFYSKSIAYALIPLILIIVAALFWYLVGRCGSRKQPWNAPRGIDGKSRRDPNSTYPIDRYVLSVVILLYLIYPTLCKQSFRLFTCIEFGGRSYLSQDLEVECYRNVHLTMVLFIGVPQILAYVIGLPLLAFIIMYKKHTKRNSHHVKYRYGILYSGFRKNMLYWECVVALRKISISAVTVLVREFGVGMQIHVALLVLMGSLTLHLVAKPFVKQWQILERYEAASLIVCWCTMWSGIVFHADEKGMDQSSDSTIAFTSVFIVCINVSFMTLMILSVIHQKLVEKPSAKIFCQNTCFCSSLFKCIQRCIPLVDDRPIFVSKSKTKSSVHQHQAIDHDTPVVRSRRKIPADWKNHSRDSSIGFFSASGDSNPLYNKQTKGDGTGGKVVE